MPTAATTFRPAPWRIAVGWLSEVLSFVSSIALLVLIIVAVRDTPLSPQLTRLILAWSLPTALLASFFTRRLQRANAALEPQRDTPAV